MRKRRWAGLGSIGNSNVRLDLVVYISRRQWGGVNEGGHGVWNSEKKKNRYFYCTRLFSPRYYMAGTDTELESPTSLRPFQCNLAPLPQPNQHSRRTKADASQE